MADTSSNTPATTTISVVGLSPTAIATTQVAVASEARHKPITREGDRNATRTTASSRNPEANQAGNRQAPQNPTEATSLVSGQAVA